MTRENFWLEWFGLFGRELGTNKSPHRFFSDDPKEFLAFEQMCRDEKRPCWITVHPFREYDLPMGLEKIYYDFDDDSKYCEKCNKWIEKKKLIKEKEKGNLCPKCHQFCFTKPRKETIGKEVKIFLQMLPITCHPVIVETYKGFHIYVFLSKILTFEKRDINFASILYDSLWDHLVRLPKNFTYQFLDYQVRDIKRLARVPGTLHETWNQDCSILDRKLEIDKARPIEYYQLYGIQRNIIDVCIKETKRKIQIETEKRLKGIDEASQRLKMEENGQFEGTIRPCFLKAMNTSSISHEHRLCLLSELFHSGYKTFEQLNAIFPHFSDYDSKIQEYQIDWWLKHNPENRRPWKCRTLMAKGWCVQNDCPIWKKRKL